MKVVRGRADARWLPSRFNFALFRLFAYVRMRNAKPEPRDVAMVLDRNQNPIESFAISVWAPLTLACYMAAFLSVSFFLAIPMAIVLIQVAIGVAGIVVMPLRRGRDAIGPITILLTLLFLGMTIWFTRSQSWVRFVAWHVLILFGLNAIAAGVVFLLRGAIADFERAVGGISSEL